ncbi:12460_t:CDS:2 [Dentiscutata erythropus]|uniref:12460_t:CDS:1 n=1 Tax=Dentiscutata erythropus TaxID=1348616 RepID=A0A9N9GLD5_9GLOM|nr:12460_t:CDS:2 [Dentiscutata erythropus]
MNRVEGSLNSHLDSLPTRHTKIMLGCIVLGKKNIFPVDFDIGKTIRHLKEVINKKAKLDNPSKKHVIYEGIDIKVKFGDEKLDSDFNTFGEHFERQPTAKHIHIIMKVPAITDAAEQVKRQDIKDELELESVVLDKRIEKTSLVRFFYSMMFSFFTSPKMPKRLCDCKSNTDNKQNPECPAHEISNEANSV